MSSWYPKYKVGDRIGGRVIVEIIAIRGQKRSFTLKCKCGDISRGIINPYNTTRCPFCRETNIKVQCFLCRHTRWRRNEYINGLCAPCIRQIESHAGKIIPILRRYAWDRGCRNFPGEYTPDIGRWPTVQDVIKARTSIEKWQAERDTIELERAHANA